jgi:type IV pilus assembly protein PilO
MKKDIIPAAALQEKINALTPAHKALLFIGTFLVICGLFYFLQYQDQQTRIKKLRNSISEQEKRLATLKQAATQVASLEKDLAQSQEEFERLLAFLPDQREIPGLLEKVSELGAEAGLENILFQPQAEQPRDFYAAIPIRLDLVGTYHKLGVFLDSISKLNRILKIENISLVRQNDSSAIQVSCTAITYRFLEQASQPSQSAPAKK